MVLTLKLSSCLVIRNVLQGELTMVRWLQWRIRSSALFFTGIVDLCVLCEYVREGSIAQANYSRRLENCCHINRLILLGHARHWVQCRFKEIQVSDSVKWTTVTCK